MTSASLPVLPVAWMHDSDGEPSLVGSGCRHCDALVFPSAPVCPACMSESMDARWLSREGTLYSFTTMHVGPEHWTKPYTVGYVDLLDGVRVFAHLVDGARHIGEPVELTIAELGRSLDGEVLSTFAFRPAGK